MRIGESTSVAAFAAVNVRRPVPPLPDGERGSGGGEAKPVAIPQLGGRSNVTVAGMRSAPIKYMKACGPPRRPPLGVRNGRHAARGPGGAGGRTIRYRTVTRPRGATTSQTALSTFVNVAAVGSTAKSRT